MKVADFGVARVKMQSGVMTAETGTYRWMAPEVRIFLDITILLDSFFSEILFFLVKVFSEILWQKNAVSLSVNNTYCSTSGFLGS